MFLGTSFLVGAEIELTTFFFATVTFVTYPSEFLVRYTVSMTLEYDGVTDVTSEGALS